MKKLIYKLTHPFFRLYWRLFRPKTSGARALVLHDGKILLTKNINSGHWSFPGGKVDYPETPESCVVRELKEELDLDIEKTEFKLGEYVSAREGKTDTIHIFVISVASDYFKKQWELQDAIWFDLEGLPIDVSPATGRRIGEYRGGGRGVVGEW